MPVLRAAGSCAILSREAVLLRLPGRRERGANAEPGQVKQNMRKHSLLTALNIVLITLFAAAIVMFALPRIAPGVLIAPSSFLKVLVLIVLASLPFWWFIARPLHSAAQRYREERRKAAEEMAQQSERDWQDTFDTITDMITIHDKDFNIIRSNRAAAEAMNIPPLSVSRSKCFEKYHGAECPPQGCPSCQSLKTGLPSAVEYFEPHLGCHVEIRAIPRLDSENNVIGLIHVVRDISERKLSEERLRESNEKFVALVETTTDWVWEVDEHAVYTYTSPKVRDILGYEPEEIIGRTPFELMPPDEAKRVADFFGPIAEARRPFSLFENRNLRKDGREIVLETSAAPVFDGAGVFRGYRGIDRDVTDRKKSEQDLARSEARLRAIIEAEPECVKLLAADGTLLEMNPAGLAMIEAESLGQVRGKSMYPLVVAEHRKAFEEHVARIFSGADDALEFEIVGLRGAHRWVQTRSVPLRDGEGNITALLGVTRDVSETVKLAAQLRHSQKMEAIGTLTGGIAHDFNNILTAIIGYGNILKLKMSPEDPLRAMVDQLLASGERAAGLTQSLLTFSRKSAMAPKQVDLNEIIRRIEKMLLRIIGEDIELRTVLTAEATTAVADSGQIEQVLINLATNARDAMPSGGHLTITTERVDLDREFIMAYGYGKPGPYTMISVTDTGQGMDEQTQQKIFEPFFTTKELGKGTGLGLSIVYGIVKQHQGFINCYSRPDSGTTFKIYVPFARSQAQHGAEKPQGAPAGGNETILIAEDDQQVRDLTRMLLEDFGYRVLVARDGVEAVQVFRENKDTVQLLLFDVIMPRMAGKEAYDVIRGEQPDIRILFTSGYTDNIIYSKGMLEKGRPVVLKPVSPGNLLRRVREALDS